MIAEGKPPPRIELARERMLICRLYLGLMRTITDDYGAEFAAHSDSLADTLLTANRYTTLTLEPSGTAKSVCEQRVGRTRSSFWAIRRFSRSHWAIAAARSGRSGRTISWTAGRPPDWKNRATVRAPGDVVTIADAAPSDAVTAHRAGERAYKDRKRTGAQAKIAAQGDGAPFLPQRRPRSKEAPPQFPQVGSGKLYQGRKT